MIGRVAIRRLMSSKSLHDSTAVSGTHHMKRSVTTAPMTSRSFSASVIHDHAEHVEMDHRMPVTKFTEDEEMVRDAARMWANQELKPLVRDMDNECKTRPEVIQGLFDHGFMGMVSCVCILVNIATDWSNVYNLYIALIWTHLYYRKYLKNMAALV